jgi:hypothetical protein
MAVDKEATAMLPTVLRGVALARGRATVLPTPLSEGLPIKYRRPYGRVLLTSGSADATDSRP